MTMTLLPMINPLRCTGCGLCVTRCPVGALAISNGKATLAHPSLCNYDAACEEICPTDAIALPYQIVLKEQ